MRLENKTTIVTGTSSGIGRAIAIGFAAEGAGVAVADINLGAAEKTAARIQADGGRAIAENAFRAYPWGGLPNRRKW